MLSENAQLRARVKLAEHLDAERAQLKGENERLREELLKAQEALSKADARVTQLTESKVLLEEQVKWLKAQFYGRSSQVRVDDTSPDQSLLFNEAEVLTAIA